MRTLPSILAVGALVALGSTAQASDDVLEPKENAEKRTIPGDPRPHYYAMPSTGKLSFTVTGKGMLVLSFVNHKKGRKKSPAKVQVLLDGKAAKDLVIACSKSKAKFTETKKVKPCGRISKDVEIPAGKHEVVLKVTRSKFGVSVSPVLISEAEAGDAVAAIEEDPLGLELAPIAEEPKPEEPKPEEPSTATSSSASSSTAGSSAIEPTGSSSAESSPKPEEPAGEEADPLEGEGMDLAPIPEIGPDPYAQPEAPPEQRSRWANPWVWTLVGVGVAAGATGAIFGVQSKDAFDEANRATTPQVRVESLNDDGRKNGIIANAMFAASGAAVASAVLVLILSGPDEVEATTEVTTPTARRWGVGLDRQGAGWGVGAWFELD